MKRKRSRVNGKNGKCLTCPCHKAGVVRPACHVGVYGLPTRDGWLFPPLPCAFDAARVLAAPPCHGPAPQEHGNYSQGKRCKDCGKPTSNYSTGRCNPCAGRINGRKSRSNGKNRSPWGHPAARGRGRPRKAARVG